MQVATDVKVENVNTVIRGNVGISEGDSFLESPLVSKVACKETCRVSEDYQAAEIPNQEEKQMSENEAIGETGSGENEVMEKKKERAEKSDDNLDIVQVIATSLQKVKTEESNLKVEGEENPKEEKILDQHVAIVADQEASIEENPQSMDEGISGSQKDEKGGTMTDENIKFESSKQVLNILEAISGQNQETMVHTPDLTLDSSNMDVGTVTEACNREESIDNTFSTKAIPIQDELGETSFQGEDEKPEKSSNLVGKVMGPEESEKIKDEKIDGEEITHDGIRSGSEDVVQESHQKEILQKTATAGNTVSETGKDDENPEQKLDGPVMKHEESLQREAEEQTSTEASTEENRYEEGLAEDNIGNTQLIKAEEHSRKEMSNHEEDSEQSCLQKDEPEREKPEKSLNTVFKETETAASSEHAQTITCVREEGPIKNFEESFKEKRDEDETIDTDDINENKIPEEKNLAQDDLNEKFDAVEIEENGASTEEEKHIEEASEVSKSIESTVLECKSTEGALATELTSKTREIDIKKLQKVYELDSEEKLEVKDAGVNIEHEIQKKEEACDAELHKIATKGDETENSTIHEDSPVKVCSTVCAGDETVKQNFQVDNTEEAAPDLNCEDKSYKATDDVEGDNIINKEVYDGAEIAGTGEGTKEHTIEEGNVTEPPPKSIREETTKNFQDDEEEAENLKGEDTEERILEEGNVTDLSLESIGEETVTNFQDDEKKTEKSLGEESETVGEGDSSAHEGHQKDESPERILVKPKRDSTEEQILEEGNVTHLAQESIGEEMVINFQNDEKEAEMKEKIFEESETTGEDESTAHEGHQNDEIPEIIPEKPKRGDNKEQILEEGNIMDLPPDSIGDETITNFQDKEKEAEKSKGEIFEIFESETAAAGKSIAHEGQQRNESPETTLEKPKGEATEEWILEEGNATDLSPESIGEEKVTNFQDDEKELEKSKAKIFEKFATIGVGESTAHEGHQKDESPESIQQKPKGEEAKKWILEEGNVTDLSPKPIGEEIVTNIQDDEKEVEMSKGEILEELESESTAHEEHQKDESPERILEKPKGKDDEERTLEEGNITDLSPKSIGEENVTNSQDDENEAEMSKRETFKESKVVGEGESTAHEGHRNDEILERILEKPKGENTEERIREEGNFTDLSPESIGEEIVTNIQDDEKEAEMSKGEIFEESETVGASERTAHEGHQNGESLEIGLEKPKGKDIEERILEECNVTNLSPQSIGEEVDIKFQDYEKKTKKSKGEIFEESGTSGASESNAHEGHQNDESPKRSLEKPKGENTEEPILEEGNVTDLSPSSIEEETVANFKDDEKEAEKSKGEIFEQSETTRAGESTIQAEHQNDYNPEEIVEKPKREDTEKQILEEDNATNLSPESIGEETVTNFQDDENKGENSKDEIFEESESASTAHDGHQKDESPEIILEKPKGEDDEERILQEGNVTDLLPKSIGEEKVANIQDDKNEAEMSKREIFEDSEVVGKGESIAHEGHQNDEILERILENPKREDTEERIREEGNFTDLSPEPIGKETVKNIQDDEKEAETSKGRIFQESEIVGASERTAHERHQKGESPKIGIEKPKGEDIEERILEEGNVTDLSPSSIGEETVANFQDDEKKAEKSKGEIVEEFQTTRAGESTVQEGHQKDDSPEEVVEKPKGKDTEKQILEEGNATNLSPESTGEEIVINFQDDENKGEKSKDEIFEELESESTAHDGHQKDESPERILEKPKGEDVEERIQEECNVTDLSPSSIGEETVANFQDDEKEAEKSKVEIFEELETIGASERTAQERHQKAESPEIGIEKPKGEDIEERILEEGNVTDLSPSSIGEETIANFQDDEKEAEKSKGEIFEESETTRAGESTIQEGHQKDDSPEEIVEKPKREDTEKQILEEGNATNLSPESIREELVTNFQYDKNKGENSKDEIFEELESESTAHDGHQRDESPERILEKPKGEDAEGRILEEYNVTDLLPQSIGEEKVANTPDDENKAEMSKREIFEELETIGASERTAQERHQKAESPEIGIEKPKGEDIKERILQEGNVTDLSPSSIGEETVANLQDGEKEAEKSKVEIFEESETTRAGESTIQEGHQNDDSPEEIIEKPKGEDTEKQILNEGNATNLSPESIGEEIVTNFQDDENKGEKSKDEIFEELESDSTAHDGHQKDESPERILEKPRGEDAEERILEECNVTDLSPQSIGEEKVANTQDDENEAEMSKREIFEESKTVGVRERTADERHQQGESLEIGIEKPKGEDIEERILEKDNVTGLSPSSIGEETVANFQEDEKEAEKSKVEIFEKSEKTRAGESTVQEGHQKDDSPEEIVEKPKGEDTEKMILEGNATNLSPESIGEEIVTNFQDDENKGEKSKDEIFEELESESTAHDGHQKDESPKRILEKPKGEDDEERILEKGSVTDLSPKSIGEEKVANTQDDENEAEMSKREIFEESKTVEASERTAQERPQKYESPEIGIEKPKGEDIEERILQEGNVTDFSPSSIGEEIVANFQDDEKEAEKSKVEIFEKSETTKAGESTVQEGHQKDDSPEEIVEKPKGEDTEKHILEGNATNLSPESIGEEIVTNVQDDENKGEKSKDEIFEELESESTAHDGHQKDESPERILEKPKGEDAEERILEEEGNVTDLSPQSIGEEKVANTQDDENEAEMSKREIFEESETVGASERTAHERHQKGESPEIGIEKPKGEDIEERILEEGNVTDLSPSSIGEETVANFQDDEKEAEKSKGEIFEESETTRAGESIVQEGHQKDDSPEEIVEKPNKEDTEKQILEEGNATGLSPESIGEEIITNFQDDENKGEKSKDEIFEELESESTAHDRHQKDENPERILEKPKGKDAEERILEESNVTDLSPKSIGEEKVANIQDDENEAEMSKREAFEKSEVVGESESTAHEGHQKDEILEGSLEKPKGEDTEERIREEGNVTDLSPESIGEETVTNIQDDEKEVEMSKGEIFEESETIGASERTAHEGHRKGESLEIGQEKPKGEDIEERVLEEGNVTNLSPQSIGEEVDTNFQDYEKKAEKSKGEIFEESGIVGTGESNAHEGHQNDESPKRSLEEPKGENTEELILEEGNVTDLSPSSIGEETVANFQDDEKEAEKSKGEIFKESETTRAGESTLQEGHQKDESAEGIVENPKGEDTKEQILEEGSATNLSPESIGEETVPNFQDGENEGEKSKDEIFEESETTGVGESIHHEGHHKDEIPERILEVSFVKHEESLQGEVGNLALTKASTNETRDEEGSCVTVAEDNDDNIGLVEGKENIVKETSKDQEDSEQILQKVEPREKLDRSLNVMFHDTEPFASNEDAEKMACDKEEEATQKLGETSKEGEKENETIDTDDTKEKGIPKEDLKPLAEASEVSKNTEITVLKLASKTGEVEVEKLKRGYELDSEEKLGGKDARENIEEEIKKEETSHTDLHEVETKCDDTDRSMIQEDAHVEDSSTACIGNKAVELSCQEDENRQNGTGEAAPELNGGDQSYKTDNETENSKNQIINEEEYKGPMIADKSEGTEKQIITEEHTVTDHSLESIGKETVKSTQENEEEPEKPNVETGEELETTSVGEGIEKHNLEEKNIIKDQYTASLGAEIIEEISKEDEMAAKMPKQEVHEMLQRTEGGEDIGQQTIEEDIAAKDNFAASVGEETNKGGSYEEEKEEKEPDEEVFETTGGGQDSREQIVNEIKSIKDHSAESIEDETVRDSSQGYEVCEGCETAGASANTAKQNIEETAITDLSSLTFGEETVRQSLKEDERDAMKLKEEDKDSKLEIIERKFEATGSTEETKSETRKEEALNEDLDALNTTEPSEHETPLKESNENLVENSSVLEVSEIEIKKEILEKAEPTTNDSDSASFTVVTEETSLKEAEPEDKRQVDSYDLVYEEKGLTTVETSGTRLYVADTNPKPEETCNLGKYKDVEIPTAGKNGGDETVEKIEDEMPDEAPDTVSKNEDQIGVATSETPLDDILEENLKESSAPSPQEHELMKTEASETIDETPAKDKTPYLNTETSFVAQTTEETFMQNEDESMNPKDVSEMGSVDIQRESANEEVQKDEDEELYMPPGLTTEKDISESKDVEISKSGKTIELDNPSEISKLETLKDEDSLNLGLEKDKSEDEKPPDEASEGKCIEALGTCIDTEKAILEQKNFAKNFEGSLKEGVEVEKKAVELEAGGHGHETEASDTKNNGTVTDKNLKSVDPCEKLKCASESVADNQTNETLPETNKAKIEEEGNSVKDQNSKYVEEKMIEQRFQEGEKETNDEMEHKLEAGDHIKRTQNGNETIKDVILTEDVPESVEKVDEIENIKEQIIEEETDTKELHTACVGNKTTNEVEDLNLVSTEYFKITDSNEKTERVSLEVGEDSKREPETSPITKAQEEETTQKECIEKPADVSSSLSETSEEKIKEEIAEETDNCFDKIVTASVTTVTEETSLQDAQLDDNPVNAFDISSEEKSPETVETTGISLQGEVDSVKPEETSDLVSHLPTIEPENADKESGAMEKPDADKIEETKRYSDAVSESKDQGAEEIDETGKSLTVEKMDADKIEEEIKEASETVSEFKYQGVEAIIIDEIAAGLTLPAGKSEEQFQEPSSALLSEGKEHGTTSTIEKIEDENTKDDKILEKENLENSFATMTREEACLQKEEPRELEVSKFGFELMEDIKEDSPNEAPKEEGKTLDRPSKSEPQENVSEIQYADSPSESEKIKELTRSIESVLREGSKDEKIFDSGNLNKKDYDLPIIHSSVGEVLPGDAGQKCEEASKLEFKKIEKAFESVPKDHSPEVFTKSEATEIEEEHLETAITELRTDEDQCEETIEANEIRKNEISNEKIEEKKVDKESHPVSLGEETIKESHQEDELKAEEHPGEKTNKTFMITKNGIQNEELSEDTEKAGATENIEKQITNDDRAVEDPYLVSVRDETVKESILEEAKEGKKVEETAIKLELENQGDETNSRDATTEAKTLSEEVNSSDLELEKHDLDSSGTNDNKEIVITKDEEEPYTNFDAPPATNAAAEDEKVGDKVEEVSDPVAQEPVRETIKTYEANKEIATADIDNWKSLAEDEKHKHTYLESACNGSDAKEGLNLNDQEVYTNKPGTSSLSKTSQEEIPDKESEITEDEKQHDLASDKQTTAEVSIPAEGKRNEDGGEHTKDEETVQVSTSRHERKVDEAEIHSKICANEDGESQDQIQKLNVLSHVQDSCIEISQKEITMDLAKANVIRQDSQQLEETSHATSEKQILREADPNESTVTEAMISTSNKDVPLVMEEPIAKSFQIAEVEELEPGSASGVESEVKGVACGGEERMGDAGEETTEKSTSIDSAKISLSNLLQRSMKETSQVAGHLTEESEPITRKEEMQTEEVETFQVDEAKTDEEEGDEQKKTDSGSDGVMVEASRDMDVKVAHKKSHNILSGVGSKVKHSLAKVKKAITGKSSHPKPPSTK